MDYSKELEFAKTLAADAGKIMKRYFRSKDIGTVEKNDRTLVTLADTEINQLVIDRVRETFKTHSVSGEEQSFVADDADYIWVCDPVDGTMPFAKGIPLSTFALALVDSRSGIAQLGVVFDPFVDDLYEAVKGRGAYLNGVRIQVSKRATLNDAIIDLDMWINEKEGVGFDDPKDLLNKKDAKVLTICSAVKAGCLVADGTFDAMLFGQSKPEDVAALSVIVEEAGGKVTFLDGSAAKFNSTIYGGLVTNGLLHDELVEVLSHINYKNARFHDPSMKM